MKVKNLEVSSGALLAAAIFAYLDRDGIVASLFLACIVHELGHYCAIRVQGGRVRALRISCAGAELRLAPNWTPRAKQMIVAALAGPVANLLLAGIGMVLARRGAGEAFFFFSALNLGLAVFNLLPARWLDGGRVLESLLIWSGMLDGGEKVMQFCSWCVAALFLAAGGVLFWESEGRHFALLIAGFWMVGAELTRGRKRKRQK